MLIDTHAHLNMEPLLGDWAGYADKAYEAGITTVVVPGSEVENSRTAAAFADGTQKPTTPVKIYATVGIHPEEVGPESPIMPDSLSYLPELAGQPGVVGIGEIGLDYHQLDDHQELIPVQRQLFREQLALAKEHDLAVIVHTRRSQAMHDACDDITTVYGIKPFKGVFHSFSGGVSHYRRMAEMGAYIGVNGLITYEHNSSLRKIIAGIPLNKIVLETDSPWLVPSPVKAEYNQPAHVTIVALKLAEMLSLPLSQVMEETTHNARQLFDLS